MNRQRRSQIAQLLDQLEELSAAIEELRDEEQDAFDNMPESFQYSERGQAVDNAVSNLDYAASSVEDTIEHLREAAE